ncbi:MAG TPA: hypothetical protein DCL15_07890 [Chloroflexi bacterium]|nr:hypothetical protein [Chloroflexota bacterium]
MAVGVGSTSLSGVEVGKSKIGVGRRVGIGASTLMGGASAARSGVASPVTGSDSGSASTIGVGVTAAGKAGAAFASGGATRIGTVGAATTTDVDGAGVAVCTRKMTGAVLIALTVSTRPFAARAGRLRAIHCQPV